MKRRLKLTDPPQETQDQATDRLFLGDENSWPCWPVLPIKHKREIDSEGFPKMGLLFAGDRETIYLTNLFIRDLENCEKLKFTDRESMILHGWVVD